MLSAGGCDCKLHPPAFSFSGQENAKSFWAVSPRILARPDSGANSNMVSKSFVARSNSAILAPSSPQIIRSGQEMGLTIAAPVMNGDQIVAAVVAVVSFQEVFKVVKQSSTKSARELLDAGLPVVFVVDQNGRAVAHPDAAVAFSERPMTDLKVVQDWLETGAQVQSALAPFTLRLKCSISGPALTMMMPVLVGSPGVTVNCGTST